MLMIMLHEQSNHAVETISFQCKAPLARSVCLVGDFNGWDPAAQPMERQSDGSWILHLSLSDGHHHYQFLVDGVAMLDPEAMFVLSDERNEKVSLIAIG
jgi:1,4-alpha-glucan branching enzyme